MVYQTTSDSYANGFSRVYFLTTGSPAVVSETVAPVVFVNNTANSTTITAITLNGVNFNPTNPTTYSGYEECFLGKVLVPTTGGVTGMCVIILPP